MTAWRLRSTPRTETSGASCLDFGSARGHSVDYGHADLILERAASAEALPAVGRWLHAYAQAAVQEGVVIP